VQRLTPRALTDAPPIFHAAELPELLIVADELRRRLEEASTHPGRFVALDQVSF
jgi:hypothetical protein